MTGILKSLERGVPSMRLIALLIAATLLAGCATETAPVEEEDFGLDSDLEATEDTGVVRGVVVDNTISPIAGATITLKGPGLETMSNEVGAFGFAGVDPGQYFLEATKVGFQTVQANVLVEAGVDQPPVVRMVLEADPSSIPFVLPMHFSGHMGCSLSYIALCGLPVISDASEDSFLATFPFDSTPQWINLESVWEGTQPTGDQMNLNMGATPAGPATTFATAQGPSPLLTTANETVLAEAGVGAGQDLVGRMFAWEMEGTGIDDHTGQCVYVVLTTYCQGPGMALDQDFDFYVHAFYNWVPAEGWRFTSEGEPVPPS